MVAKDEKGNNVEVPGLILSNDVELKRFCNCIKQISLKKDRNQFEEVFDYHSKDTIEKLQFYRVKLENFLENI
jgi:hypothetical protein